MGSRLEISFFTPLSPHVGTLLTVLVDLQVIYNHFESNPIAHVLLSLSFCLSFFRHVKFFSL
jgi:hypothetical protein